MFYYTTTAQTNPTLLLSVTDLYPNQNRINGQANDTESTERDRLLPINVRQDSEQEQRIQITKLVTTIQTLVESLDDTQLNVYYNLGGGQAINAGSIQFTIANKKITVINIVNPATLPPYSEMFLVLLDVATVFQFLAGPAGVLNVPNKRSPRKAGKCALTMFKGVAALMAFMSALKAFTGASSFAENQMHVPKGWSADLVGGLAAIPSFFFGYSSAEKIASKAYTSWRDRGYHLPQFENYKRQFNTLLSATFPTLTNEYKTALWEYFLRGVLGIGYGAANFGMVLSAFPKIFDYEGLKEALLAGVLFTNTMVGLDKTPKVLNDLKLAFTKADYGIWQVETKLLQAALVDFESVVKKYKVYGHEQRKKIRESLQAWFCEQDLAIVLATIENAVKEIEQNSRRVTPGSISIQIDEPIDALNAPFFYRIRVPANWYNPAEFLGSVVSITVSFLAVSSNIGAITTLPTLAPLSLPLRLIISLVGSTAAFSLNKGVLDSWKESFLTHVTSDVIRIYQKDNTPFCPNPFSGWKVTDWLALVWSAFSATANVYFTGESIKNLLSEGTYRTVLKYAAEGSVGLMGTATKAIPTAALLRVPFSCCCKSQTQDYINQAIRNHYDSMIETVLRCIIELAKVNNDYCKKLSEMLRYRFGVQPFKISQQIQNLNIELKNKETREQLYQAVIAKYLQIRAQVVRAYSAFTNGTDLAYDYNTSHSYFQRGGYS